MRMSRRFLLGAAGATLALPALRSVRAARSEPPPPRLLVYFLPNGRRPEWWVPERVGRGLVFPEEASALQPFADRALSVTGLTNLAALDSPSVAHSVGTSTVLSGATLRAPLSEPNNDLTVDQAIARRQVPTSRFASLQWGAGTPSSCGGDVTCTYTQAISWAGPGQALLPTLDPAAAFDRLFRSETDGLSGAAATRRRRAVGSVLDATREDARRLEGQVAADDRHTLDAYFTALRELEQSLAVSGGLDPSLEPPGDDLDYEARVDAFHELVRLAFQTDQTRVLSFMLEFGLSYRKHDFLGVSAGHHFLSHFNSPEQKAALRTIETWQNACLADLLGRLAATAGTTAGTTLLDETIVVGVSSMGAGDVHDHTHCPLFVSGSGLLASGARLDVPESTPLADVWVTLLRIYGIDAPLGRDGGAFGDHGTASIGGMVP